MSGLSIAIVDDDEEVRDALSELLEVSGFDCCTFESAAAFLECYKVDRFGCLITDIKMPGMDGLELLDRLNALGSTTPVLIVTSVVDDHVRDRALKAGAHAFLQKPVTEEAMLTKLRSALDPCRHYGRSQ
jgi:two-component system, LuxR family, response regulator FixJ